jgi:hypothetical protein
MKTLISTNLTSTPIEIRLENAAKKLSDLKADSSSTESDINHAEYEFAHIVTLLHHKSGQY